MFLTQKNEITCIHEPFCDAYHFGPERLSERFQDEKVRLESGLSDITYKMVLDNIENARVEVGSRCSLSRSIAIMVPSRSAKGSLTSVQGKTRLY